MDRETQNKIEELTRRIETLEQTQQRQAENSVTELEADRTRQNIEDFVAEKLDQLHWRNLIQFNTFFESIDGYSITETTAGNVSVDGGELLVATDATSSDSSKILKEPTWNSVITFSQNSEFRTSFNLNSVADVTAYFTVGDVAGGLQGYGFKVVDDVLYGVTHDGTTENTVQLTDSYDTNNNNFHARYFTDGRVYFWYNSNLIATTGDNVPSPTRSVNTKLMSVELTTGAASIKQLKTSFFQYSQRLQLGEAEI